MIGEAGGGGGGGGRVQTAPLLKWRGSWVTHLQDALAAHSVVWASPGLPSSDEVNED